MEGLFYKAKRLTHSGGSRLNISVTDIQCGFVNTEMAKGDGKFWVATPEKAAMQIYNAIKNNKKKAYVTKRWWLIAQLLKWIPGFLYKKIS